MPKVLNLDENQETAFEPIEIVMDGKGYRVDKISGSTMVKVMELQGELPEELRKKIADGTATDKDFAEHSENNDIDTMYEIGVLILNAPKEELLEHDYRKYARAIQFIFESIKEASSPLDSPSDSEK